MTTRRWLLAASGLSLLLVGGGLGHLLSEHPSYPLGVWRMDLDDLLSNVGLFLAGLAAFLTVFRKAGRAEKRVVEVEEQLNGGGLQERLEQDEHDTKDLDLRLESLEAERNECRTELAAMRATLRGLGGGG